MTTKTGMTRIIFREWMATEGWTVRKLASTLNVYPSTVGRWRDGTSDIPPYLPLALIALTGQRRAEK